MRQVYNLIVVVITIFVFIPILIAAGLGYIHTTVDISQIVEFYYVVVMILAFLDALKGFRWWRRVVREGL